LKKYKKYIKKNWKNITSGAPWMWCAISSLTTNGALSTGAPLVVLKKK
jgi:hypothetical protein